MADYYSLALPGLGDSLMLSQKMKRNRSKCKTPILAFPNNGTIIEGDLFTMLTKDQENCWSLSHIIGIAKNN